MLASLKNRIKPFDYYADKLLTKPHDPFIGYEWAEVQDLTKYPAEHPILVKLHLLKLYKLLRIAVYDFKNFWS